MRVLKLLAITIAVTFFAVPYALAAVTGGAHDIDAYTGAGGGSGTKSTTKGGTCSYCHVPHGAQGDRLWPSAKITGLSGWKDTAIGNLCWSCHQGTTYTDASMGEPFLASAHGRVKANVTTWGDVATFPADVRLDNTNLGCNSCHNVHSNDFRPFQAWGTANDLQTACKKCHLARANETPVRGWSNTGHHPTEVSIADRAAGAGYGAANMVGTINTAFAVTLRTTTNYAGAAADRWDLGGHRGTSAADGPMICATCHTVHGNEGDTTIPNNLLAIQNAGAATSALCQGCHEANPGLAGTFTHPINTLQAAWQAAVTIPATGGWDLGVSGSDNVLVCSTCHDMHYARTNTALWRAGATTDNAYASYCGECHTGDVTWAAADGKHHPSGATSAVVTLGTNMRGSGSTAPLISTTDADINWNQNFATLGASAVINTAGTARYVLGGDGRLNCGTCHASGAHNLTSAFPGVVGRATESEMCVDCHSFNPSSYTSVETTQAMSHYVGPILNTNYKRTTAFDNSLIVPEYASDGSTNGEIMCKSCHGIRKNSNYAAGAVKQVSKNNGTVPAMKSNVRASVALLLEKAGNDIEVTTAADSGKYMCTGCHGAAPGNTGTTTHPVQPTVDNAATTDVTGRIATAAQATLTANSKVNCESCHRPHDATTGSGGFILEGVATGSDKALFSLHGNSGTGHYTDQQGLCTQCHNR